MADALLTVTSLVLVIVLGFVIAHIIKVPRGFTDMLSKIVFNITIPCAIFHAFALAQFDLWLLILAGLGLATTFIPWLIGTVIVRNEEYTRRVFMMMNISGFNIGSFVLPFAQMVFPAGSVLYVCLFDAGNALMMSGGVYAFSSAILNKGATHSERVKLALKRLFSSVPFDLYIIFIILAILHLQVPSFLVTLVEPVSNANAFLAMLMLGMMVNFSIDKTKMGQLVRLLGLRFGLSALMSVAIFFMPLPLDMSIRIIIIAILWSPIGALGPVFTMWAKGDVGLAGFANVISVIVGVAAMTVAAVMLA
ncbi:MAG: AEC family transporter [Eggerthellaceae bacterium]